MKDIYYAKDGQPQGPYQLDELKGHPISRNTLIWAEGLPEWVEAEKLSWMEELLKKVPPPIPTQNSRTLTSGESKVPKSSEPTENIHSNERYDLSYKKNESLLWFGIASPIVGALISTANEPELLAVVSLLVLLMGVITVTSEAKKQNRDTLVWALFALFAPPLAMIWISFLRRKLLPIHLDPAADEVENSKALLGKAKVLFSESKMVDAKRFTNKAIELDPSNDDAKEFYRKVDFLLKGIELYKFQDEGGNTVEFQLKNKSLKGAMVTVNGLKANDGEYLWQLPFPTYGDRGKFYIKDGIVKEWTRLYLTTYKDIMVEETRQFSPEVGNRVMTTDKTHVPDGVYKLGLFKSSIDVEGGKIVRVR